MNHEIKTFMKNTSYYRMKPPGRYSRYNVDQKMLNEIVSRMFS